MNEAFLHYIWQLQYFDKTALQTTEGEPVTIIHPGTANTNAGPDFSNANIKIGELGWAGSVEIHIDASAWISHGHENDRAYDNVVLHVVWKNDAQVLRADGTHMPTLELHERVDLRLIEAYRQLANNSSAIPCQKSFPYVSDLVKMSMLDKALMQRLERKAEEVIQFFFQWGQDWEEVAYRLLARNFGFKINSEPFFVLSQGLPRRILSKHRDQRLQLEALLFGQAGFLDHHIRDEYFRLLQREYQVLAVKYGIEKEKLNFSTWKFLRLRPANFPTQRLAQFAALFHKNGNLFSKMIDVERLTDIKQLFDVESSEYWKHHYRFGHRTSRPIFGIGYDSVDNIIVNTVAPLLVAFGKYKDDQRFVDRAVEFLQQLPAESNRITKVWDEFGLHARSSFDSQALIELNNNFCLKRNCLSCTIGASLLKPHYV